MSTEDKIRSVHDEELDENQAGQFYIPEKYQLGVLTDYLESHGFDYVTEGRVFCYPIDILCARDDTTVAIEMKSEKISRGVEQAWRNTDFVDFSYLAVWEDQISESLIETASEKPIGLLAVGDNIEQVCSPTKTPKQLCGHDMILTTVRKHVRDDSSVQQSQ